MASNVGGQWVFSLPANNNPTVSGFSSFQLSTNNGTSFFPAPLAGAFNLEVFVAGSAPAQDTVNGFQATATDIGAAVVGGLLTGSTLVLGSGSYQVTDTVSGTHVAGSAILGSGAQTVTGGVGDSLTGGSGTGVLNATAANELVVGGTGLYSVFGGAGDTIQGNSGATSSTGGLIISSGSTANTIGGAGNELIAVPGAGTNLIFSGAGDTITGGPSTAGGTTAIFGWRGDLVNLTGGSGAITVVGAGVIGAFNAATPGPDTIIGGTGTQALFGTAGDSIVGGQGGTEQIVDATASIVVGSGGSEVIASGGSDTITALAGAANPLIALSAKDSLNLTGNTGAELILGAAGVAVTVGSGSVGMAGAASETIVLGTGADNIIGSSVAGSGDTLTGSGAINLTYNPGVNGGALGGSDVLNLAGSTGTAVINAFSNGTVQGAVNDTINAGSGADTIFGGGGDRMGVGNATAAGGTHLWLHSTTATGSMAFGTNDAATGSKAAVTVGAVSGGSVVGGFSTGTGATFTGADNLFYQGESALTNGTLTAAATATTIGGVASSIITLSDGSVLTLVGVTTTTLTAMNTAGVLFKT
jgi:hypothetical protein